MSDNLDHEKYPLSFPNQAYGLLRSYRIGPFKSFNPNPETTELSQQMVESIWYGPEGSFSLDMENENHVLWVRVGLALDEVRDVKYENDIRFKCFKANRIGLLDPSSDTGDFVTLSIKQIATVVSRPQRTVYRWIERVEDDFIMELKSRNLLSHDWESEDSRLN